MSKLVARLSSFGSNPDIPQKSQIGDISKNSRVQCPAQLSTFVFFVKPSFLTFLWIFPVFSFHKNIVYSQTLFGLLIAPKFLIFMFFYTFQCLISLFRLHTKKFGITLLSFFLYEPLFKFSLFFNGLSQFPVFRLVLFSVFMGLYAKSSLLSHFSSVLF